MADSKYLLDTVKASFNAADEVDARAKEQADGLSEAERRMLRSLPPKCRILDIGCATGRASIALAKEGHTLTGIDVAEQLIEKAQAATQKHGFAITYQVCDPVRLPFADAVFHAVLLLKTYCYVPTRHNRVAWLGEIARVLKPNSWLFLSQYILDGILDDYDPIREDNRQRFPDLLETLEEGDGFSTHENPTFIHYFFQADLRNELTNAPFQLVDSFQEETIGYYVLKNRLPVKDV